MRHGDNGRRLSPLERADIHHRVVHGETHRSVAAAVGCSTKSIQRLFVRTGGFAPSGALRSPLRLSLAEREEISRCLAAGDSLRTVARRLERAPSTIAREVRPNGGRSGYRAYQAECRARRQARRPRASKLARYPQLRIVVERWLARRWSPQQIAHRLPLEYPTDSSMRISHETIYRSLFIQARGALRRELTRYLRTGRTQRRAHTRPTRTGRLRDLVLLADRPAEAADRAVPGHWEGDLILGRAGRSAIGSVVERRSRFVLLLRLPKGRTAEQVRRRLAVRMTTLPAQLRRTLTWDQGKEMAEHVQFRVQTGIPIYFCDPRSPWQRPTSENTNGLLRQYFPSSTDLSRYTQAELDAVARELNGRPRETLAWSKPAEVFAQAVATTG